jgi:Reverse transcriptase (RNA-dependent DNA polymerase)
VRRSNSPWASPLHMVPKPDGSWRSCGDYRHLNLATIHDCYPLPNIMDFSNRLAGCTVFSTIDLVRGYHQVLMAAADIPKTAIITLFGLFVYVFMPFVLRNAAQTFQRLMDRLFRHLPFVFTYLDDHLIASHTAAEHHSLPNIRCERKLLSLSHPCAYPFPPPRLTGRGLVYTHVCIFLCVRWYGMGSTLCVQSSQLPVSTSHTPTTNR